MIGLFYIVTVKSGLNPLSFQGVKDVFGSLLLIKEGGEGGSGSLKEVPAPSFSQVFKRLLFPQHYLPFNTRNVPVSRSPLPGNVPLSVDNHVLPVICISDGCLTRSS